MSVYYYKTCPDCGEVYCNRCRHTFPWRHPGLVPVAEGAIIIEHPVGVQAMIEDEIEAGLRFIEAPPIGWGYLAIPMAETIVKRLRAAAGEKAG